MVLSEDELKKEIKAFTESHSESVKSEEYNQFRSEVMPGRFTLYEKACNFCSNIVKLSPDKKKLAELQEALETCHLNTTPAGVTSFAILFPIAFILLGVALSFTLFSLIAPGSSMFFMFMFIIFGLILIVPLTTLPMLLANNWRLKASNQMVLSVFYIVSYMRHTSNLELAIKFASDHISPPLSLDFKKIMWNVESSKFKSVKDSLDDYLSRWKKYTPEFVESIHLIQSSLLEPSEKKRQEALEKSLSLILEATYEKMFHFAQDLKEPITMLHMLGVILPILGLVILPLVVSFMENVQWYHISVLYNVFLPLSVWYLGKKILSTRPTGYGQADITEVNPELKKHTMLTMKLGKKEVSFNPIWISAIIFLVFLVIGIMPLILHLTSTVSGQFFDIIVNEKWQVISTTDPEALKAAKFTFLGYKESKDGTQLLGPYGLGATLISIFIPLGLALAMAFYFTARTKKLVKIRAETKALENEFAAAIFQLGNRIGDGLPAEIAFSKVSHIMEGTKSGQFFDLVTTNLSTLGMGVEDAIFDPKHGAITKFPSALIESSMKVFVESAKKGPEIASQSLINISTYIKEMHRVDERLKDLMSEITSSMRSQINFLAPLISGIVIGLTSMITTILITLGNQVTSFSSSNVAGTTTGLLELFSDSIPTFYFQIVVGIYVVQITYLLTTMLNTIENGYDPLNERFMLGNFIRKSGVLYSAIAFAVIMMFNIIAATVVSGLVLTG
ncbi:TPA: hypothetical protein HA239_04950 [Candidatus Woesearchaeota archaeon]|nr:hypothetical protein QT06_C0001G0349 [archaeon GW2011_AR15]HIH41733.1 hypothetical protein [Candidatus Woesearchaeota archaeon]